MTDPLANLLALMDSEIYDTAGCWSFADQADWLRARRADVIRALYPDIADALTDLGLTRHAAITGLRNGGYDGMPEGIWRWEQPREVWVQPAEDAR